MHVTNKFIQYFAIVIQYVNFMHMTCFYFTIVFIIKGGAKFFGERETTKKQKKIGRFNS